MRSKKGRLFVIDGSDGSGKATQTARAVLALKEQGKSVRTMDFPQYEKNLFGQFIGGCLMGEYGDFLTLDPHITSVIYAADRFESSRIIKKWISDGHTVILDRYVSANQIHQGGKIFDSQKRKEFLLWLDTMEYGVFGLPRPDRVVYLDVPIATSVGLLQKAREKKNYIKKGKKDLVEQSMHYLDNSRKSALWLSRHEKNWHRIRCVSGNAMRSIDDIHREIMTIIS